MSYARRALIAMETSLWSRRAFFTGLMKGAGVAVAYDAIAPQLAAQDSTPEAIFDEALAAFSGMGRLVIPVDQDPGWATFEPEITRYGLDTYVRQVFALGNSLVFDGLTQAMSLVNTIPPTIRYGPRFLDMSLAAQGEYLTNILIGSFENDGVQDILSFGAIFMLLGVKQTFFLNFPRHLATPGAEYQDRAGLSPKTGWDIMGFKGPVGAVEERALRERARNAPELPGVDLRNPWI